MTSSTDKKSKKGLGGWRINWGKKRRVSLSEMARVTLYDHLIYQKSWQCWREVLRPITWGSRNGGRGKNLSETARKITELFRKEQELVLEVGRKEWFL